MFAALSFALFAWLVGTVFYFNPTFRQTVVDYLITGAALTATGVIDAWRLVRRMAIVLFWVVAVYAGLFAFAVLLGNPYLTFMVLMLGASPAFLAMYALYVLRLPVAEASRLLKQRSEWVFKTLPAMFMPPSNLNPATAGGLGSGLWGLIAQISYAMVNGIWLLVSLPVRTVAGMLYVIGDLLGVAEEMMRRLVVALAGITLWFLLWAVAALVDITAVFPFQLTHPAIIGAVSMAAMAQATVWVMGDRAGAAIRLMLWAIMLGLVVAVAGFFGHTPQLAWAYVTAFNGAAAWTWFFTLVLAGWWLSGMVQAAHGLGGHGGPGPNMIRRTALTLGSVVLLWTWFHPLMDPWTPQRGDKREITAGTVVTSQITAAKTREVMAGMNSAFATAGDADWAQYRNAVMPRAAKANELRMAYYEAQATADGENIGEPALVVDPSQSVWQFRIPFLGPKRITAQGTVISQDGGETQSDPNGKPMPTGQTFTLVADGMPYLALVGRICAQNSGESQPRCGEPIYIGSGRTLCPGNLSIPSGDDVWIELRVNEGRSSIFHGENQGGYRFRHEPAQTAACQ